MCNLLFIRWELEGERYLPRPLRASGFASASETNECPLAEIPPTPVLPADLPGLSRALGRLGVVVERPAELEEIFTAARTKLGQFFQLLFWIQNHSILPVTVAPPGITDVLLTARVFTSDAFPRQISAVSLQRDNPNRPPRYRVEFSSPEVRFPINQGIGFAAWDQRMCQIARELVFANGFSFRLRRARNSKNLVVDDLKGVQLFGTFGSRVIFDIDLNYVDLEKIEFIDGTDEGKVTCRVADREFRENKHSSFFRFIGTLIPSTSRQRIDW